ncbi:MAG: hypothetical protein WAR79_00360 [Melioribacteraceae bacterium]
MKTFEELFIEAIHNKKLISIKMNSKEKGIIQRICVPFDFGPGKRYKDGINRFHVLDLDSPDGKHNLGILPTQLIDLEILDESFEPGDYVTWKTNWIVPRDWGEYS